MGRLRGWLATLAILGVGAASCGLPALRVYWRFRESNPVQRGQEVAARSGCFSCHGPHGTKGLPDPGTGQEVPAWDGGVPMMYVSGPEEVREYILDGVSRRRAASASASAGRARAAIRMPAYREILRPVEIEDLVAYFMAASRMEPVSDPAAARGRELVRRLRCESCHGAGGAGGVANPGSFKGYVPGWLGADFGELVADDGELQDWVRDGGIGRFARSRLARHFLKRQRLQMPAYRSALAPEEIDAIVAYIKWLRKST